MRQKFLLGQTLMLALEDFQRRLDADLKRRRVKGIPARHRNVFMHLNLHGPSRSADLAVAAGIRPQSMMKIVHELEDLGLITRSADPSDSRAKLIDFTPAGRRFIAELSRSTCTVWDHYAAKAGAKQLETCLQTLERLRDGEATETGT